MIFRILILLTSISNIAIGQSNLRAPKNAFDFIDTTIVKDKLTVKFLDYVLPEDIQNILLRVQKAMIDNKKWSEEYFSKYYKPGEGLPYHENFGVTKEEYQKVKEIDKIQTTIISKNSTVLNKTRNGDILSFSADEEKYQLFKFLEIDLKNELMIFRNDTIPYKEEINATNESPFGEWHGYSWEKDISNIGENDDIKFDKLISKTIEITFGRIKKTNKILFFLKYKDVDSGQIISNIDIACYLD